MAPTLRGNYDWTPANIPVTEAAYLAGLFDGEGSIAISHRASRTPGSGPEHFVVAILTMADEATISRFHRVFGGYLYRPKPRPGRPLYRWAIRQGQLAPFIATLRPYMAIKAAQLELAEQFLLDAFHPSGRQRRTDELIARRESARTQMSELNHSHHLSKRAPTHPT